MLGAGFDIVMVVRKDLSKELTYNSAETTFLQLAKEVKLIV